MPRGTRKREATHGSALADNVRCPVCRGAHVLITQSRNGRLAGDFLCATCGHFFDAEDVPRVGKAR